MPRRDTPDALSALIGRRIRVLREEAGLTLEKLAYESELGSKGHLSDIERGLVRPTVQTLQVLADRLGAATFDLLTTPEGTPRHALVEATRRLPPEAIATLKQLADTLGRDMAGNEPAPFRTVVPAPEERGRTCVALMDLAAAAGGFTLAMTPTVRAWVMPATRRKLRPGMFVAQVVGRSMEPDIQNGAWCLFAGPVRGDLQGRVVLVQHRGIHDADTGANFTVKRFEGEMGETDQGVQGWRRIQLVPSNPEFSPIQLSPRDADDLRVVAEFLTTLPG